MWIAIKEFSLDWDSPLAIQNDDELIEPTVLDGLMTREFFEIHLPQLILESLKCIEQELDKNHKIYLKEGRNVWQKMTFASVNERPVDEFAKAVIQHVWFHRNNEIKQVAQRIIEKAPAVYFSYMTRFANN